MAHTHDQLQSSTRVIPYGNHRMSLRASSRIIYIFTGIILALIVILMSLGTPADHETYLEFIMDPQASMATGEFSLRFIIFFTSLFPSLQTTLFFAIYAVLGVSIKLYALFKKSKLPLLTLIFYIPSYFLLHEYVQLRVAVALGFFLLALDDIKHRNLKGYLLKSSLALLFHWSSAIMLPLYLISKPIKWPFLVTLPLCGLGLNFIQLAPYLATHAVDGEVGFIQTYYALHAGHSASVNVFNVISLFQMTLFVIFIHSSNKVRTNTALKNAFSPMIEIYSISLFCFFLFSALELPVVAFRLSEYLNIVLFLLIPETILYIKNKLSLALFSALYYLLYCLHLLVNTQIIPDLKLFHP